MHVADTFLHLAWALPYRSVLPVAAVVLGPVTALALWGQARYLLAHLILDLTETKEA